MPSENRVISSEIDGAFNSLLAEAFFCGVYTLLLGYTLRALLRKENKRIYATVLTCQWLLVMISFAFDWQHHRTTFVIDDDSPLDIAIGFVDDGNVQSLVILDNIFSSSCIWLADALIIWRCYILWEGKRWVLLPLPILLAATIVLGSLSNVTKFRNTAELEDFIFIASSFVVSVAITFVGTSLIILRILLVTRSSHLTTHSSGYRKIQRILVESGMPYTVVMFIAGVTLAMQVGTLKPLSIPLTQISTYTEAILVPMAGIGPTLIAVRVGSEVPLLTAVGALQSRSLSQALSHLTFRRTVQPDGTFDIEDGVPDHGDSPTNSSPGQDGQYHIEKVTVHSSDITT